MLQIGLSDRYTRQVANQQVSAIAGVPMPTPGQVFTFGFELREEPLIAGPPTG
jgi:hypothetical protein